MEATNWYWHKSSESQRNLDDLKAFVLLTAIKNLREDVVARFVQRLAFKANVLSEDSKTGASFIASSLASLYLRHELNQKLLESYPRLDLPGRRGIRRQRRKKEMLVFVKLGYTVWTSFFSRGFDHARGRTTQ